MSLLRVQCGVFEPKELKPGDRLELHRRFVTGGDEDTRVSRSGNAALLFDKDGEWFVHNQSQNKTLMLVIVEDGHDDRIHHIPQEAARKLIAPYSELHVGGPHRVGLTIHRSDSRMNSNGPGDVTDPPLDLGIERSLQELFQRRPQVRTVTFLRFQTFLPDGRRYPTRPRPLTAAEVTLCHSGVTQGQVNQIQRDVKDVTGLDADELGPWLIEHGILRPRDRIGLPHDKCAHRSPN
jgi:hypothetical protein